MNPFSELYFGAVWRTMNMIVKLEKTEPGKFELSRSVDIYSAYIDRLIYITVC